MTPVILKAFPSILVYVKNDKCTVCQHFTEVKILPTSTLSVYRINFVQNIIHTIE